MNLHIEKIGWEQLETVYHTYMVPDFDGHGLKPLSAIRYLWDKGCYEGIFLYEGTDLRAYALFVADRETGYLLLDYLAVCSRERGRGYGGSFLAMMKEHFSGENGILLEAESVNSSPDEEQFRVRSRRRRFYLQNGCRITKVKSLLFGGEYDIFYIPLKSEEVQAREEMERIYHLMFPEPVYKQNIRVWKRQNWLMSVSAWQKCGRLQGEKPQGEKLQGEKSQGEKLQEEKQRGEKLREGRPQESGLQERKSLLDALGFADGGIPQIISLVGGGGKTTTMYQLADELAELGRRVLITTTTHIGEPKEGQVALVHHVSELKEDSWKGKILTAGIPIMDKMHEKEIRKLSMPEGLDDPQELRRLLDVADVIIIEADGAKCRPIKVPQEWEPVILPQTGLVIACAGLSAVGRTFEEACFRFEKKGGWLARAASDPIEPEDVALILMDERGSRKHLDGRYYRIILNQADHEQRIADAKAVIRALPVTMQQDCVVSAYGQNENNVIK